MGLEGSKKGLLSNKVLSTGASLLKKYMMIVVTIIAFLFFVIGTGGTMISSMNMTNLISQNGYIIVLAIGMLLCILTGGNIDLSVGSVILFVSNIAGVLMIYNNLNFFLTLIICILVGLAVGAWQGFWIAYMRIPAFIVTLAGMLLFKGLGMMVNPESLTGIPTILLDIFGGYLPSYIGWIIAVAVVLVYVGFKVLDRMKKIKKGFKTEHIAIMIISCVLISFCTLGLMGVLSGFKGMPSLLIILAIITLAYSYFTAKTVYGRQLYAMGGNEKAAKLSGINTNKMLFFAYVNMAFLCVIAAFMCLARFQAASPQIGDGYEMDAIAACYVGGASAYGGRGTVSGVVIGAIFVGILNNGMLLMSVNPHLRLVIRAFVVLAAVAFDIISKRRGKTA